MCQVSRLTCDITRVRKDEGHALATKENDNQFQIIRNYEEKQEVLKSSGTTRNNSGINHRKKKTCSGTRD